MYLYTYLAIGVEEGKYLAAGLGVVEQPELSSTLHGLLLEAEPRPAVIVSERNATRIRRLLIKPTTVLVLLLFVPLVKGHFQHWAWQSTEP